MAKSLKLVTEQKLVKLLDNVDEARLLEASGVLVRADDILVVMDCIKGIARLEGQTDTDPLGKGSIVGSQQETDGYEAITQDRKTGRLYLMIEALERGKSYQAKVAELDANFKKIDTEWLDFEFSSQGKGFEGGAVVRRKGDLLLLALCEGNYCKGGKKGKKKGHGMIQVFKKRRKSWKHVGRIKLPKEADFEDYASIAIRGKRVAIVSQAASALWVGTLELSSLKIAGKGRVYRFPLNMEGECVYCNVEGVDWLADERVVLVSDRMKADDQPQRCAGKDKSIHIMEIPR